MAKPTTQQQAGASPAVVQTQAVANPFQRQQSQHLAVGSVEIEMQRAIAEVQASLTIAKARPRDPYKAFEKMIESCQRIGFASKAFYSYPRGGQTVSGPSIRMAEELARNWGNMEYGIRELSNRDGETEMEAYAWDLETNMRSSQRFVVKHEVHTKNGVKELSDPRDIYEMGANLGARRLRSRILAVLPPDYVESAIQQCGLTISGGQGRSMADRVADMLKAFAALGVKKDHIEKRIGVKLDQMLPEQFTELIGIYNSIKDGQSKPTEWFGGGATATPSEGSPLADINKKVADQQAAPAATASAEEEVI